MVVFFLKIRGAISQVKVVMGRLQGFKDSPQSLHYGF